MVTSFRSAAVIGAGTMGRQIAGILASAGLNVLLLNRAASGSNKNAKVEAAFKAMLKDSPSPFFTEEATRRITLGNFEDDFPKIADADLIIEAAVEVPEIKLPILSTIEQYAKPGAICGSNTSGIPIKAAISPNGSSAFTSLTP